MADDYKDSNRVNNDDTLNNGEPLSADSAEMSVFQPFLLNDDSSSDSKNNSNSNPLDQYNFDLGSQNMGGMDGGGGLVETVEENPELLAAL